MSFPVPDALMDSSSVKAEAIAAVATIDISVDKNQGATAKFWTLLGYVKKKLANARLGAKHCARDSQAMA
jgi:hypothetical protein